MEVALKPRCAISGRGFISSQLATPEVGAAPASMVAVNGRAVRCRIVQRLKHPGLCDGVVAAEEELGKVPFASEALNCAAPESIFSLALSSVGDKDKNSPSRSQPSLMCP